MKRIEGSYFAVAAFFIGFRIGAVYELQKLGKPWDEPKLR
jgi:hypothetical protein